MTDTEPRTSTPTASTPTSRRITPRRGLPGGRAVVGALLVAVAAVAVFAAYLDAVGGPTERYLVAAQPIPAGTTVDDVGTVRELFASTPLDLSDALARRAIPDGDADQLAGRTIIAPLAPGELLQRSAIAETDGERGGHVMSLVLPHASAVGGNVVAGQHVDVVATTGRGGQATTSYVVRAIPVLDVDDARGAGTVVLTVAVRDVDEVQAVGHALHTAEVFIVLAPEDGGTDLPAPFRGGPGGEDLDEALAEAGDD